MSTVGGVWRTWSRTEAVRPRRIERPADAEAVQRAVLAAARHRMPVKAVGSGYSFSGIAVAPSVQLDVSALTGLIAVDEPRGRVTLGAGTTLKRAVALLAPLGLTLPVFGDIDRETIGGALSTGTHGTGNALASLSASVLSVTLVDGRGDVHRVSASEEPELLPAVRVALGSLGIVTAVELQCARTVPIRTRETSLPIREAVDGFLETASQVDHHQLFWFPGGGTALAETYERMPAGSPLRPRARLARWVSDELVDNGVLGAVCRVSGIVPAAVRLLQASVAALAPEREYVEVPGSAFPEHRGVRFRELEYAVPLAAVPEVLAEAIELVRRRRWRMPFPVLVRTGAPEDSWLAPAHGRATGWIGVHQYWRSPVHPYFDEFERILVAAGGRPCWAMMHSLDEHALRRLYPRFDDFLAVRDRLDPDRLFANDYLDRVLGR